MIPKVVLVSRALTALRPGAKFSINNNDVDTIIWHTENVEPVTQEELDAQVAILEAEINNGN